MFLYMCVNMLVLYIVEIFVELSYFDAQAMGIPTTIHASELIAVQPFDLAVFYSVNVVAFCIISL